MLPAYLIAVLLATSSPMFPVAHASELTKADMMQIATDEAKAHHLNVDRFLKTIECESFYEGISWNTHAKGDFRNGKPTSFGLAQFHNPESDWGITPEEAEDPYIAIPLMAQAWEDDLYPKWSCWRLLYAS